MTSSTIPDLCNALDNLTFATQLDPALVTCTCISKFPIVVRDISQQLTIYFF